MKNGEVFGLVGPKGAGKSTCFGMLASQISCTSGQIELLGHPRDSMLKSGQGKRIGICNEGNLILDNLTVEESLDLIASLKGVTGLEQCEQVKRIVTHNLNLAELKNISTKKLSVANKRKLCFAQALMLCPKILLLDEPVCNVDPITRSSFNRMIR